MAINDIYSIIQRVYLVYLISLLARSLYLSHAHFVVDMNIELILSHLSCTRQLIDYACLLILQHEHTNI